MPGFLAEALTFPRNYTYALGVQTAMGLGLPPTLFILPDRESSEGWTPVDKKLAIAWTILQKETCKECGQPLWVCRSSDIRLSFSVRTDTCYARKEVAKFEKSAAGKKLKDGESPYIVPVMRSEDGALPSRMAYLNALNED